MNLDKILKVTRIIGKCGFFSLGGAVTLGWAFAFSGISTPPGSSEAILFPLLAGTFHIILVPIVKFSGCRWCCSNIGLRILKNI